MTVLHRMIDAFPRSPTRVPSWLRIAAVPIVVVLVLLGVWVTSGLITNEFRLAQVLTGLFFAVAGAFAVLVGLRWRALALPVIATYAVVSLTVSGILLITSTRDVVATGPVTAAGSTGTQVLGSGGFTSAAHETRGTARILATADGSRVLTLTEFATDPGPDLRVYLVPGDGTSVRGGVNLGGLKGIGATRSMRSRPTSTPSSTARSSSGAGPSPSHSAPPNSLPSDLAGACSPPGSSLTGRRA